MKQMRTGGPTALTLSLLAACATFLGACANRSGYCPAPVWADEPTTDWFIEREHEITPAVRDWLNRIGKQQRKIRQECN